MHSLIRDSFYHGVVAAGSLTGVRHREEWALVPSARNSEPTCRVLSSTNLI